MFLRLLDPRMGIWKDEWYVSSGTSFTVFLQLGLKAAVSTSFTERRAVWQLQALERYPYNSILRRL